MLVPVSSARTNSTLLKALRAGACGSVAALVVIVRRRIAAERDRQRRHPHHHLPPHPPQGRHHHHLQGEWPVRPGRAEEGQPRAARLAHRQADQHGPAPDRRALGGLSGDRRQGADPRHRRLPFAGHQRHAAPPLQRASPSTASTCSARRSTSTSRTSSSSRSATPACGCSAAASASIRPPARPFVHMDVGSVRHWPRMPEAQLARIMAKGPLTQRGLQHPAAQPKTKAAVVVASRNVRDEDEDAEVVARPAPAPRGRVGRRRSAPQPRDRSSQPPCRCRSRARGAIAASSRRRPVSTSPPPPRSRCARRRVSRVEPESASRRLRPRPSGGFNLASAVAQVRAAASGAGREPSTRRRTTSSTSAATGRAWSRPERPVPPADIPEARPAAVAGSADHRQRRAAAWRRGRCPTARRRATPGLCAGQRSPSRPVRARPRRPASSPSSRRGSERHRRQAAHQAADRQAAGADGHASRSASASTIRGCAR